VHSRESLFNLSFLIHHMLADFWVKFFDLHLSWHGALILGSGVKVTSAGTGNKSDFITHGVLSLDLFATGAQIFKNCVYTVFINDAHATR